MKRMKGNSWRSVSIFKNALKIGFLLVCVSMLGACAQSSLSTEQRGGNKHIDFLYNFSTNSLDPHVESSYIPLRAGITETLVRLDEGNLTIAPWLAESWEGEDGRNWTIKLREDGHLSKRTENGW